MSGALSISLSRETLESGSEEERATFGLFAMTANDRLLTAGEDVAHGALRHGPHVAGCPAAEWFVWNWWRLRWEGGSPAEPRAARRWSFAHRMSSIGEGYAWPNVTIQSDGLRSILRSEPSRDPGATAFRHIGAAEHETVPAGSLEAAIDGFVEDVLARLGESRGANLHRLWDDLRAEREDPALARFRRFEARLGCDPDEADEGAILRHLEDAAELGEEALGEIADDAAFAGVAPGAMMSARDIREAAARDGFDADPAGAAALADIAGLPRPGTVEAWRAGYGGARKLRDREGLDGAPISDTRLAELAGATTAAVTQRRRRGGLSFALDGPDGRARVALRSRWKTGRRFALARLIGDRILGAAGDRPAERLFPATRAYSYRQQAQRAFAAELLSPFGAVEDMLEGDYSEDKQTAAARRFDVSPMTIQTQLVNHGRLDRADAPDVAGRGAGWGREMATGT